MSTAPPSAAPGGALALKRQRRLWTCTSCRGKERQIRERFPLPLWPCPLLQHPPRTRQRSRQVHIWTNDRQRHSPGRHFSEAFFPALVPWSLDASRGGRDSCRTFAVRVAYENNPL